MEEVEEVGNTATYDFLFFFFKSNFCWIVQPLQNWGMRSINKNFVLEAF